MYNEHENGKRLIELRQNRGLSIEEAAAASGITSSVLCAYETGTRNPRDDVKTALADFYGVTVQSIFYPDNKSDQMIHVNYRMRSSGTEKAKDPVIDQAEALAQALCNLLDTAHHSDDTDLYIAAVDAGFFLAEDLCTMLTSLL